MNDLRFLGLHALLKKLISQFVSSRERCKSAFNPSMKLANIFLLIVVFIGLSEAKSRPKRTLGTILNFFGYKLVPVHGGQGSTESLADIPAEKYEYQPETPRNPKFMRIQTVMPFRVVEVTSKPSFAFDVRQGVMTEEQTEPPTTSEVPMENTSATLVDAPASEASPTQAPRPQTDAPMAQNEPTMMPMEAATPTAPLKIILEDMETPTSQQPQPAAPEMEQMSSTEASAVEPQPDNSISQQEFPSRFNSNEQAIGTNFNQQEFPSRFMDGNEQPIGTNFNSNEQPIGNSFGQQNQFQPHDVNSLSHDHQFHQFPPQFPAFNQPNPNFEIFKSRDLSDSFIGQPNHFGSFQPQLVQQPQFISARPFTNFHDQSAHPSNVYSQYSPYQGRNHFSTSRTSMNMNGQAYDYMTRHH